MARDSLFSILSRAPWWASVAVAAGLFAVARWFLPEIIAAGLSLPFVAIAGYAGWRQLRTPSAARVAVTLDKLRAMTWDEFNAAIADAYRRDGYGVTEITGGAADFEITRSGRVSLVGCRRWKVAQTGVGPLRELHDAKKSRDAHDCICISAGEFSANAREFAEQETIQLVTGAALVALVGHDAQKWFRR